MQEVEFVCFDDVNHEELQQVVNENPLRKHLVDHEYFDEASLQLWMDDKIETDAQPGCRVRVVLIDGKLAGWCGIQPDERGFEVAIVLSKEFWGHGISIFKTIMSWAKEMNHREIVFHLLETRPEYRFLNKLSSKVEKTQMMGRGFTTYWLTV